MIQIRNRWNREEIFGEGETWRDAVAKAIANRGSLTDADLTDAVLTRADLTDAVLTRAVLDGPPGIEPPRSLAEAALRTKQWLSEEVNGSCRWLSGKWIDTPHGAYAGDCKACLHGAAIYVGGQFGRELSARLNEAGFTIEWNDTTDRTLPEVLAAVDSVAVEAA